LPPNTHHELVSAVYGNGAHFVCIHICAQDNNRVLFYDDMEGFTMQYLPMAQRHNFISHPLQRYSKRGYTLTVALYQQ
jgi:hypothetical protein